VSAADEIRALVDREAALSAELTAIRAELTAIRAALGTAREPEFGPHKHSKVALILSALRDGPQCVAQLAERCSAPPSTIQVSLSRLHRRGAVARGPGHMWTLAGGDS
jgi:predicted Rossmann fold nucleotide-binding protein DprA/Smf involved in DNA uptake